MKVLVTGGSGFLGKALVRLLSDRSYEVIAPSSSDCDLLELSEARTSTALDFFRDLRPDVVVHLAATVGGIGANRARPATFWYENLIMGANVLHAAQRAKVPKLVMVGTTCSYPKEPKTIPFVESELFDGYPEGTNAPYGIAKRALLVGARAYQQEFGLNAITLIPTNLYGPGDNFDPEASHVIPGMIRKLHEAKISKAKECQHWGTGFPTRDFLYVDDAAEAIERAIRLYDKILPINLGSGVEVRIRDLAAIVRETVGYEGDIVWDITKPDGQPRRCLDTRRARTELGWSASTELREGIKRTYAWYLANQEETRRIAR